MDRPHKKRLIYSTAKHLVKRWTSQCLLCFALCLAFWPNLSFSEQADKVTLTLPEQVLSKSLRTTANRFRLTILFESVVVAGLRAPAVNQALSLQEALATLLHATALQYRITDSGILVYPRKELSADGTRNTDRHESDEAVKPLEQLTVVGEARDYGCCRDTPSTATKTFVPTNEVPQSLEGISWSLIHNSGNATLKESFEDYSSASTRNYIGQIYLRGFQLNQRAILKNGHSVVSHGIASPLLQNFDGIEVAKGVNSTLYGHGIPSGVVNLIRKLPKPNAFTNISLSYGDQDGHIALDHNAGYMPGTQLQHRYNLMIREERSNENTEGVLRYYLFAPTLRKLFDDGSVLDFGLDINRQEITGNRGIRLVEQVNGDAAQTLFYGFDTPFDDHTSYPENGPDYDDPQRSTIIELNGLFEKTLASDWRLSGSIYAGQQEAKKNFFSDLNWLANVYFDTQEFGYVAGRAPIPTILAFDRLIIDTDGIQGIIKPFRPYQNETGLTLKGDVYSAQDFPYWIEPGPHFYSILFEDAEKAQQLSSDWNLQRMFSWARTEHEILMGMSYAYKSSDLRRDTAYNSELYSQGTTLLESATDDEQRRLGYALRRYATGTAYNPFGPSVTPDVRLPDTIAIKAGLDPQQHWAYNADYTQRKNSNRVTTTGLYVQDQIDFNEYFKARIGLGIYYYRSEVDSMELNNFGLLSGHRLPLVLDTVVEDVFVAPTAGLVFQPRHNLSVFLSYGKQYDIVDGLSGPTEAFEPEESVAYETGIKWWPLREYDLTFNFSVYQITIENWLIGEPSQFGEAVFNRQEGRFRTEGAEISLTGSLTPHWEVASSYTKVRPSVLEESGLRYDSNAISATRHLPKRLGSFWFRHHFTPFGHHGWSLGAGVSYIGSRDEEFTTIELPLDSYKIYDLNISYKQSPFRITMSVDNVTDEYWLLGGSSTTQVQFNSKNFFEGYSRRIRFNLDWYL